ncbi:MAG TPA: hypothetical protein VFU14_20380 [Acidimicrobiales bacterium]|nr:hypothetical protein [Acidimicrobiales bacterium]
MTAVEASLIAAAIGGATGIVGQLVGSWLQRSHERRMRQLDDLARAQDALARMAPLYRRFAVSRITSRWSDDDTQAFIAVRGELLALYERILDTDAREALLAFRQAVSVVPNPGMEDSCIQTMQRTFDAAHPALGKQVRRLLG